MWRLASRTAATTCPIPGGPRYLEGHIPGAAFLDLDTELSDLSVPPDVGGRHPLPSADRFAAAAGRAGVGPDTLVVAYDEGMTGGAARLWWLLRHFGHEQAAVLDGGLRTWLGPLAQGEETIEPAVFMPQARGDDDHDRRDPRAAGATRGSSSSMRGRMTATAAKPWGSIP